MLYDPKWNTQTKSPPRPDMWSLANLIAWLEKQDPDAEYCWMEAESCLLGQYASNMGVPASALKAVSISLSAKKEFWDIAVERRPYTFGAALERARALAR